MTLAETDPLKAVSEMLKVVLTPNLGKIMEFNTRKTDGKMNQMIDNIIKYALPDFVKLSAEIDAVEATTHSIIELILTKQFMNDGGGFKWGDLAKVIEMEMTVRNRASADDLADEMSGMKVNA